MAQKLVGIIMGSDSDLPVMIEAVKILEQFGVAHEVTIVSAHRTPKKMYDYAQAAVKRGLKVIIAGAGGAVHLPGMTASLTALPVIGVPVMTRTAKGIDSLFSIAQMPPGIPVATMAINGAKNAGLFAVHILAANDAKLQKKLERYKAQLNKEVLKKASRLERDGFRKYLSQ